MAVSSDDDVVIKSPNDRRLYRHVQLPNGLSTLLVHDPEIYVGDEPEPAEDHSSDEGSDEEGEEDDDEDEDDDEEEEEDDKEEEDGEEDENVEEKKRGAQKKAAAAAMCVGMGTFNDPYEAQGLAHFLEHMLFMGSTEFPDENEYDRYLSKHGGSSNAYTETEHTCYHFEVEREFLKGALRRFSQFFVSPLFKPEAMEREVLAVDSEFNHALQSDSCRLQQLQCHTSAPGHPFNRFLWGNKKSLVGAMKNGINLRERILDLYNKNYHAGAMKLVVIGGENLDTLESWVVEMFSNIKSGTQITTETPARLEFPTWKSGKIYWLEAVEDVHILELSWTLPSLRNDYLKKTEDYLDHLFGHEGRGGLHYFLKAKGWATSVDAGVGDDGMERSTIAYVFSITIHLTDSGLEKMYEVIGFVYLYIKLLCETAPQEWIYKELQDTANLDFLFAEEQPQDDYAAKLAENMLVYPVDHVIYGEYAYEIWDEEMIKYVLGFFRPDNMRVDVITKSLKSQDMKIEPWFGSKYAEEDIPSSLMELWKYLPKVATSLHLPAMNEFIPHDFSIRADSISSDISDASVPKCIVDEPSLKLWYKLDKTFKLPRANAYFRITLNWATKTLKNALLTELFGLLLKDELNEIMYQAIVAKLETSISVYSDKLELKVHGFNHKLPNLLKKILTTTKSFLPNEDRFKVIKEDMKRNLKNTNMKPLHHSSYSRQKALSKKFWDVEKKLCMLNDLSLSDLTDFIPDLLSRIYVEGLCHGNLSEKEAIAISDIFTSNFSVTLLPKKLKHRENIMRLPPGADIVKNVKVKNKREKNSVVELYYQIEPEEQEISGLARLNALINLFDEIVDEPFFNQLRTKEQLGCIVDYSPRATLRRMGYSFRVQSSEYDPEYLQSRIHDFIFSLEDMLNGLDDESFENYKSGLLGKLLEKDPSLLHETERYWDQIVDRSYTFDLSEKEAVELGSIQKGDIIEWYRTYLRHPSPKCRRLTVRLWGCHHTSLKDSVDKISTSLSKQRIG